MISYLKSIKYKKSSLFSPKWCHFGHLQRGSDQSGSSGLSAALLCPNSVSGSRNVVFWMLNLVVFILNVKILYKEDIGTGTTIEKTPEMQRVKRTQDNISSVHTQGLVFNTHSTAANSTWNNIFFLFFFSLHLANSGLAITHPDKGDFLEVFAHSCYFNSNLSND